MVQKVSGIEKIYGNGEGGRECHNFRSKIFNLTVPKTLLGKPFCVSENLGFRKFLWIIGDITIFHWNFQSHSAEKHRGGALFWFGKFGVLKNCMMSWGLSRFSDRKYSVSQYRKSL